MSRSRLTCPFLARGSSVHVSLKAHLSISRSRLTFPYPAQGSPVHVSLKSHLSTSSSRLTCLYLVQGSPVHVSLKSHLSTSSSRLTCPYLVQGSPVHVSLKAADGLLVVGDLVYVLLKAVPLAFGGLGGAAGGLSDTESWRGEEGRVRGSWHCGIKG